MRRLLADDNYQLAVFSETRPVLDPASILPGHWRVDFSGSGPGNHLALSTKRTYSRSHDQEAEIIYSNEWRDDQTRATMRIIVAQYGCWTIVAVHLPASRSQLSALAWELFGQHSSWLSETPALIVGDWNSGGPADRQGNKPFTLEQQFQALSAEYQWVDLWRLANGSEREYSWYSRAGRGFRIDHAFISPAGAELVADQSVACYYDHRFREQGASDHSALRVVVK